MSLVPLGVCPSCLALASVDGLVFPPLDLVLATQRLAQPGACFRPPQLEPRHHRRAFVSPPWRRRLTRPHLASSRIVISLPRSRGARLKNDSNWPGRAWVNPRCIGIESMVLHSRLRGPPTVRGSKYKKMKSGYCCHIYSNQKALETVC